MTISNIFTMPSPYRDDFRIRGYRFGSGKKSVAIVGAMRGDEIQQLFICSQIVRQLTALEAKGAIAEGHEILVIPCANPFSINIAKRFWAMDNTDINRMFPGYDLGETTQRIAAGVFDAVKDYQFGIQLASFYMPGDFIPHVRMQHTGYEDVESARLFGMPYIAVKNPKSYDTTLLNYNWQIWSCHAFSLYGGQNHDIESPKTSAAIDAALRFMRRVGALSHYSSLSPDFNSVVLHDSDLVSIVAPDSGIMHLTRHAGDVVSCGDTIGRIIDPYDGNTISTIEAPVSGVVFFNHNKPLVLRHTPIIKLAAQ
ncbi:MAG: M14 family metallopeptidase [Muribaculaceae bacterium]